jgi:hypothetical protein
VGFEKGGLTLKEEHDNLLDDQRTFNMIQELFSAIRDISGYGENSFLESSPMSNRYAQTCNPGESSEQKLHRPTDTKAKRIAQVEQLSSLVNVLYRLIPINTATSMVPGYHEPTREYESIGRVDGIRCGYQTCESNLTVLLGNFKDRKTWFTEFQRMMRRIERENDGKSFLLFFLNTEHFAHKSSQNETGLTGMAIGKLPP